MDFIMSIGYKDYKQDILECPWCGTKPYIDLAEPTGEAEIACIRVLCEVNPGTIQPTMLDAIVVWNERYG